MQTSSRLDIDLTAIEHNLGVIRDVLRAGSEGRTPPAMCAVLKADAYGLGAKRIAKRLSMLGVEMIAVSTPAQARELIAAAIDVPLLMLMPVRELRRDDALYRAVSRGRVHLSVHDEASLREVMHVAEGLGITVPVHIEVDTGMSRDGALPSDALRLLLSIAEHRRLRLAGVFTHFASADVSAEETDRQSERFDEWLRTAGALVSEDCLVHAANSYALFRSRSQHRRMVRIGLALYGYGNETLAGDESGIEFVDRLASLRPALRWVSRFSQFKRVAEGERVGYRGTWVAPRDTLLGVVPVGYADGYPIGLSSDGVERFGFGDGCAKVGVIVEGDVRAYLPVVGRVSMEQIVVDLTDLRGHEATIETEVELIGLEPSAPNALGKLAERAGTIPHELLCRISPRVERLYLATKDADRRAPLSLARVQMAPARESAAPIAS